MRRAPASLGSVIFFLFAPGIVVGLRPWLLTQWRWRALPPYWIPLRIAGAMLLIAGLAVLVNAFWRFVVEGRGTPAPAAPTEHLVVGGLYRHVRNPMYVAVLAAIVGQALLLAAPVLLVYAGAVALAVAAFVKWYEEPTLQRRYGRQYDTYRDAVPGWWPRLRPWVREQRN